MEKNKFDAVYGAMAGDIIGSVYEWENIKTKEFDLWTPNCTFTDDSVMTIAVMSAFKKWIDGGKRKDLREILIAQMKYIGLKYPDCGYGGNFAQWLRLKNSEAYNSYGNGSAMRVSSAGAFANIKEEAIEYATMSADVTHDHPEGIKGAVATAVAIFMARTGASMDEIRQEIHNYYTLDFTLDEIRPGYVFDVSCQGSVPQALEAFFESASFEDAIRNAISIGGDSDTIAAITGSIAAAYYGIDENIKAKVGEYLDDFLNEIVKVCVDCRR